MKDVNKILDKLEETYPDAQCELKYETPFELLVATILSAQCTDVRVNKVTKELFAKSTTQFIKQATILHKNKYNYDQVEYKNSHQKIKIYCSLVLFKKYNIH